ncbi:hypothetical protein GJ744_005097 [Endocarpon pusillum]|uniref:Zn(2)-C6 fungal-type domain-containing protein n=1 Tax=Endocarpon pusillum TaxID=364733 RepID=A0A8H7AL82_9EURO|nr:hypothetical protein GJ744_005097 [Endocarpon pusillum]
MSPPRPTHPTLAPFPTGVGNRVGSLPAPSVRSRKASTACLACKQRKSKCNEGTPCESCQLRQSPCIYDRNADQRRRAASQKNTEELNRQRTLLGGILAIIQAAQPEKLDYLCNLIRGNATLTDLATHIESSLNADPEIFELSQQIMRSNEEQTQGPTGSRRSNEDRIRPQSLILPPIPQLAYPWTTLASDEVVSHLVSLYFTWEQPCLQFVDKMAFLADMKAGDVARRHSFCSPLLVSALLAQACLISQRAECQVLRTRFLGEAKVRLELQRGRASVTTLQALVLLYLHEGVTGRDRIGRTYYLQAMDMWGRLGFDQYCSRPYDCEESAAARQDWRAKTVAVWGIFCVENFMSFLSGFEPNLSAPRMERYFEFYSAEDRTDLDARDGDWSPYPMQRPEQRALLAKTLSAVSSLCQIYHEISAWNNNPPDNVPLGSAQDLAFRCHSFKNLATWNAQLHLSLRPSACTMAHAYYLNNLYHATHISLFRPLQELEDVRMPIEIGSPRDLCFKHASECMETIWAYRKTFSLRHSSCIGLLGPYMVVLTLSPQLRDGAHKNEPFIRACQALVELSENFPVAPYILAMLKALDMEHQFGFPEEAIMILQESSLQPEELEDIPVEMRVPILTRSPVVAGDPGSSPVATTESVGELLARWAGPFE